MEKRFCSLKKASKRYVLHSVASGMWIKEKDPLKREGLCGGAYRIRYL